MGVGVGDAQRLVLAALEQNLYPPSDQSGLSLILIRPSWQATSSSWFLE